MQRRYQVNDDLRGTRYLMMDKGLRKRWISANGARLLRLGVHSSTALRRRPLTGLDCWPFDAKTPHPVNQRRPGYAQPRRRTLGSTQHAVSFMQDLKDVSAFDLFQGRTGRDSFRFGLPQLGEGWLE